MKKFHRKNEKKIEKKVLENKILKLTQRTLFSSKGRKDITFRSKKGFKPKNKVLL